ncbi:MAG: helix-turn-helix transcriptional regulator [Acidibacillus sp.]|nr:helix-turn-helix transcriptional regulator [Acidibacillus sp.]
MGESNRLREVLQESGIEQTWLADRAGVTYQTLSDIVNGKRTPTLPVAKRIARTLELSIEEIGPK